MFSGILQNILEISLSMSVLVIILFILTPIFNRRYTATWRYWVWMIIAIRLILPINFSLPQAIVNIEAPEQVVLNFDRPIPNLEKLPQGDGVTDEGTPYEESKTASTPADSNQSIRVISIRDTLTLIWLAGFSIILLWQIFVFLHFKSRIKKWQHQPAGKEVLYILDSTIAELGIKQRVDLKICPNVSSPMIVSLISPKVLLPSEEYDSEKLYFILRHELTHLKRRDILFKILLFLAGAVHWFNPLIWLMAREAGRDIEISCDDHTIRRMNREQRARYADTIMSCIGKKQALTPTATTHFNGGFKAMKKRFNNIFDLRKKRSGLIALSLVIVAALALGGFVACSPVDKAPQSSQNSTENSTEELENYYKTYLELWTFYNPFTENFSGGKPEIGNTELLFNSCWGLDYRKENPGADNWLDKLYEVADSDGYFPAELVEKTIMKYFNYTANEIRSSAGSLYNSGKDAYLFQGGFGGGGYICKVTQATKDGSTLSLKSDWYDVEGNYSFSADTQIDLKEDGSWIYTSNSVSKKQNEDEGYYYDMILNFGGEIQENEQGEDIIIPSVLSFYYIEDLEVSKLKADDFYSWYWSMMQKENITIDARNLKYKNPHGEGKGFFFPQDEYEQKVKTYFDVTTEYLRSGEAYDPEYKGYWLEGHVGIGERPEIRLYRAVTNGDKIDLHLSFVSGSYNYPNSVVYKILTVKTDEFGRYKYISFKTDPNPSPEQIASTKQDNTGISSGMPSLYENKELGIRVQFPEIWQDNYVAQMQESGYQYIEDTGYSIQLSYKEANTPNILGYIYAVPVEVWEQVKSTSTSFSVVLGKNSKYVFAIDMWKNPFTEGADKELFDKMSFKPSEMISMTTITEPEQN